MIRNFVTALLILLCFVLQCTLFQALSFSGIVPNLMIVLTATFGFMRGKKNGLIVGFFCGLLMDVFFGEVIGFYALIYMYLGYGNGFFKTLFFKEDIKLPLILIICSDVVYSLTCYGLLFLLRSRFQFSYYLLHIIIPEVVYTILITVILYPIVLLMNRKFDENEKRSAKKFV
ncbi:MAG TPA: rod shape-determining protein MreD [Lachnospiraceae bacterium]|nr:rod shape-determining protein MreD [Lachnospiraceae bacterium]